MSDKLNLKKVMIDPLWDDNPITLQMLGVCSALAVTGNCKVALTMCFALTAVVTLSNIAISAMRNFIPDNVKIIVQLAVIASLVIMADQILAAYMYEQSKALSVFVGLIITNCIVLGRATAFAMANPPVASAVDGFANGLGYSFILMFVAVIREVLGTGTIFDKPIPYFSSWYEVNGLMVLPPAAFFLIGIFIWIQRTLTPKMQEEE